MENPRTNYGGMNDLEPRVLFWGKHIFWADEKVIFQYG